MTKLIKKISQMFSLNGLNYKLLQRIAGVAIYEISGPKGAKGYEVHIIRLKRFGKMVQTPFTHYEGIATNTEFGTYGWYIRSKSDAWAKFKSLLKKGAKTPSHEDSGKKTRSAPLQEAIA